MRAEMTLTSNLTRDRGIGLGLVTALLSVTLAACGSSPPASTGPAPTGPDSISPASTGPDSISPASTGPASISPASASSVVSVPVRIAHTTLGPVGYRVVGSGPPLVMIMGYAGTMEVWDPRFVDALAQHYRVVIFDNAGVGQTQALPAPLTIDAMADQTSALISALGLGRPDVLGWSMGGMIAQALTVRHPAQVRRLVLCATFPGTGAAVVPSQAVVQALTSSNPGPYLYPANQAAAWDAFVAAISRYPAASSAPAAVIAAQGNASLGWFVGTDPAGRRIATIEVPTLIADGTADRIDATANDRVLAGLIGGSRMVLYPDAGHAFLFQEGTPFTSLVESFFGGAQN
jgi:pimeloyl-ACP methyl ester carboxylesterase